MSKNKAKKHKQVEKVKHIADLFEHTPIPEKAKKSKKSIVEIDTNNSTQDIVYLRIINSKGEQIGDVAVYSEGLIEISVTTEPIKSLGGIKKDVEISIESIGKKDLQLNVDKLNNDQCLKIENICQEDQKIVYI